MLPVLKKLEPLMETRFLKMYKVNYEHGDKTGAWVMVSRKSATGLFENWNKIRPDAVVCMALVDDGSGELKLLITKEYRHPIQNFEYGFVAGLIDGSETAESTARRELMEEAGLSLEKVLQVSPPIVSSAGLSDESVQMVICLASGKISNAGNEAAEIIEPMLLDYEGVRRLCDRTGEFEGVVIAAKAWPLLYMIRQMGRISTAFYMG